MPASEDASALGGAPSESISTAQLDPDSGLVIDARMPVVKATCTGCHSAKLVVANRGTRKDWAERLRWMQKNHNLWALEPAVRDTILDYLSDHYAPDAPMGSLRRAPLPDHLMPPDASELDARSGATPSEVAS